MAHVEDSDDIEVVYAHLTAKAKKLLSDLNTFYEYTNRHEGRTLRPEFGYSKFQSDVQREARLLEKHGAKFQAKMAEPTESGPQDSLDGRWPVSTAGKYAAELHQIRSSNIGHLDLIWQDVISSKGVLGIRKNVKYTRGAPKKDPQIKVPDKHNFHARKRSQQMMQVEQRKQEAKDRQVVHQQQQSQQPFYPILQQPFYPVQSQQQYQQWTAVNKSWNQQASFMQGPPMLYPSGPQGQYPSNQQMQPYVNQMVPVQQQIFNQQTQVHQYTINVQYNSWPQQPQPLQPSWQPTIPQYQPQQRSFSPQNASQTQSSHQPLIVRSPPKKQEQEHEKPDVEKPIHPGRNDRDSVVVDVICEHGSRWIKLFTKTQRWLALDLAKEGLVDLGCDSDDDEDKTGPKFFNEKDKALLEDIKLVKMAREYQRAARSARFNHRHPMIHFHLPKISRGVDDDVDIVIKYLESIGVVVVDAEELKEIWDCSKVAEDQDQNAGYFAELTISQVKSREETEKTGEGEDVEGAETTSNGSSLQEPTRSEILSTGGTSQTSTVPTPDAFERQVSEAEPSQHHFAAFDRMTRPAEEEPLTATLNLDCTALIALISEISHRPRDIIKLPGHYTGRPAGKDILLQMASEESDALLVNHIYPLLRGKKLVCTDQAAAHLNSIVQLMGSPDETLRSHLILQYPTSSTRSQDSVRQSFGELSSHVVPADLGLPIQVVMAAGSRNNRSLDGQVMNMLSGHPRLSPLNQSVFFHGWLTDTTTVSLNRVVSDWLGRAVDGCLDDLEWRDRIKKDIVETKPFRGPRVRMCGRERSLVGSEKFLDSKRGSVYD